jgi:hypothetical protein
MRKWPITQIMVGVPWVITRTTAATFGISIDLFFQRAHGERNYRGKKKKKTQTNAK